MSAPQIAAAICTYDRYDLLPTAVSSLLDQTLTGDKYRILVVDNSPDHERARAFSKRFDGFPNLTYIVETTPGLSNARNVAAAACHTRYIAFMDDDAIASPAWLEEILRAFDANGANAAVVGGRVYPLWATPRPSWLHDTMLGNLSVVDYGDEMRPANPEEWFAGTNISFRTDAILSNRGFPTNLGRVGSGSTLMSNEEIQIIERIRAAGGKLIYAPKASIQHLAAPERLTRAWFRKRFAWQAVSDFTMEPDRINKAATHYWKEILRFFNNQPPHLRTLRGLLEETDDPELFRWQCGVIYMLMGMMLAGAEDASIE